MQQRHRGQVQTRLSAATSTRRGAGRGNWAGREAVDRGMLTLYVSWAEGKGTLTDQCDRCRNTAYEHDVRCLLFRLVCSVQGAECRFKG